MPRTVLPNARVVPRFAGVSTFCRVPLIDDVGADCRPVDWALYGIPFDGGVTYRPGARFGPRAIRDASQYTRPVHLEHKIDITEVLSIADAGDAPVKPYSCKDTFDAARVFASGIGDATHTKLLAVGGDHSIALANIAATWERRGRTDSGLAVLHFDAHLATVAEVGDGKCPFRGYPKRYELDDRCPVTVRCEMIQGKFANPEGGYEGFLFPVPVVESESYCKVCLNDMVREKEAGIDVRLRQPSADSGGVLKGRRVKTPTADRATRRKQREDEASRFLKGQQGQ